MFEVGRKASSSVSDLPGDADGSSPEQLVGMGMQEGMALAVGQIDAILAAG